MHGLRDVAEWTLTGGFDHELKAAVEQGLHERNELAGLQHGFSSGELNQAAGSERVDLSENLVGAERLATREGVLGVTPGATKITASEAHKDAGQAGEGAFALNGFVEFDEVHGAICVRAGRSYS